MRSPLASLYLAPFLFDLLKNGLELARLSHQSAAVSSRRRSSGRPRTFWTSHWTMISDPTCSAKGRTNRSAFSFRYVHARVAPAAWNACAQPQAMLWSLAMPRTRPLLPLRLKESASDDISQRDQGYRVTMRGKLQDRGRKKGETGLWLEHPKTSGVVTEALIAVNGTLVPSADYT